VGKLPYKFVQDLFLHHQKVQKREADEIKKTSKVRGGKFQPSSLSQLKGLPGVRVKKKR